MDCDDEVGLVKCDDYSHANTSDIAGVARLSLLVAIHAERMGDHLFRIGNREAMLARPILGVA